jgi:2',3'-cyclic-nucleotide 2'-phosphodiesterase (5'-nucleotidase family)
MGGATVFNRVFICAVLVTTIGCASLNPYPKVDATKKRVVTLLFTNDFESAFDPIPAYWNPDIEYLGGIAHIATLVDNLRQQEDLVFLFDAGDIFTGVLSKKN